MSLNSRFMGWLGGLVTPFDDDTTPPPGTNLLARLTVRDPAGNVVAQVEPTVVSGWSLTTDTPVGSAAPAPC